MNKSRHIPAWCASGITFILLAYGSIQNQAQKRTYCNPLDIDYKYNFEQKARNISYRSGADPVLINHLGEYYLFSTIADGYWHSKDLRDFSIFDLKKCRRRADFFIRREENVEKFLEDPWVLEVVAELVRFLDVAEPGTEMRTVKGKNGSSVASPQPREGRSALREGRGEKEVE